MTNLKRSMLDLQRRFEDSEDRMQDQLEVEEKLSTDLEESEKKIILLEEELKTNASRLKQNPLQNEGETEAILVTRSESEICKSAFCPIEPNDCDALNEFTSSSSKRILLDSSTRTSIISLCKCEMELGKLETDFCATKISMFWKKVLLLLSIITITILDPTETFTEIELDLFREPDY